MSLRIAAAAAVVCSSAFAAERHTLDESNYDALVPAGKEVDAIYGDFLLKSDTAVAVVAAPVVGRDANLTVRNVGGSVIDLTLADEPNDQLSCFFAGGGRYRYTETIDWPAEWGPPTGAAIAVAGEALKLGDDANEKPIAIQTGYELRDGEAMVRVVTTLTNNGDEPIDVELRDGWRVDGPFETADAPELSLWWADETYWGQAYGVQTSDADWDLHSLDPRNNRGPQQVVATPPDANEDAIRLAPGQSVTWRRNLLCGADSLAVRALAHELRGEELAVGRVSVSSADAPVAGAKVTVFRDGEVIGYGSTNEEGQLTAAVRPGSHEVTIAANAHGQTTLSGDIEATPAAIDIEVPIELPECGYVVAKITNGKAQPIPAKVQFIGVDGTDSPNFGPESAVRGVANLQYTPDGRFRAKLKPGSYRWIASYGSEHDAAFGRLVIGAGETVELRASLPRTVDTTGWISSEMHSHSSPSGDNTASQAGRVLNLLAEHLEFCPCTEHQRLDVYDEHLTAFDAAHRMLTCPGMELTGRPLPVNHQNAFPLIHKPHQQHGGAPLVDTDPVEQIKRLAGWDNNAEKVVQSNHINFAQVVGDKNLDGTPDLGFERMFGFMDVVEVDPPESIFTPLGEPGDADSGVGTGGAEGRGNEMVNWLQCLNLGYRVTGVVNTDAHYNRHGSGWLRNWVRSSTDDPARASVDELIHEYEHGHVVMSNGPYLLVTASAAGATAIPGDDLKADHGKAKLRVVVRCPNWLDVNRVQLFINGRPEPQYNYTIRSHAEWFGEGPEVFDQEIEVDLKEDAHIVVACCGEDRQLGVVFGEQFGQAMPTAVANPIFVDTDGDANADGYPFEPNGDDLGLPLPLPEDFKPSHGHDHPNHRR